MEPSTGEKVKIIMNGYADTSISTIENGIVADYCASVIRTAQVEFQLIEIIFMFLGYDYDRSKKSTIIGYYTFAIDLPYGVIITFPNKNLIHHRGGNLPIFTAKACKLCMDVNDDAKKITRKQKFHARY